MPDTFSVAARSGRNIRLGELTWREKIAASHPELGQNPGYLDEMRKTISDPDYVIKGRAGEFLALRWCETAPKRPKYLCVIYKEPNGEGFVITAFFESRPNRLLRREILWRKR